MPKAEIRKALFESDLPTHKEVEITPGVRVRLRRLGWSEVQEATKAGFVGERWDAARWEAALLIMACEDENGEKVFSPIDFDDMKSAPPQYMQRLTRENYAFQGLSDKEIDLGKAVSESLRPETSFFASAENSGASPQSSAIAST